MQLAPLATRVSAASANAVHVTMALDPCVGLLQSFVITGGGGAVVAGGGGGGGGCVVAGGGGGGGGCVVAGGGGGGGGGGGFKAPIMSPNAATVSTWQPSMD